MFPERNRPSRIQNFTLEKQAKGQEDTVTKPGRCESLDEMNIWGMLEALMYSV